MGGGGARQKDPSFSPVTSTKVGTSPKNCLTFSFNPFVILALNFKSKPSSNPELLNLNQDYPSKKQFFWSVPYKTEIMITSLIAAFHTQGSGN